LGQIVAQIAISTKPGPTAQRRDGLF